MTEHRSSATLEWHACFVNLMKLKNDIAKFNFHLESPKGSTLKYLIADSREHLISLNSIATTIT